MIEWSKWNLGEKLIFGAGCAAVLSLLMPWTDVGQIGSNSGLADLGFFWLAFFVYPVKSLLLKEISDRKIALASSGAAILTAIILILRRASDLGMGVSYNFSGSGLYLFLLSAIALAVGVWLNDKNVEKEPETKPVRLVPDEVNDPEEETQTPAKSSQEESGTEEPETESTESEEKKEK
jgi:hypothetical protein